MASPAAVALGGQGRLYPRRRDVPPEPTSAPTGAGQTAAVWHLPHVPGDAAHRVRCGGEPGSAACPGAVCGPGRAAPGQRYRPRRVQHPAVPGPGEPRPAPAHKTYDIAGADLTPALSRHRFGPGEAARASRERWLPWHERVPYLALDRSATTWRPRWPGGRPALRGSRGTARSTAQPPAWPRSRPTRKTPPVSRTLALPLSRAKRRQLSAAAGVLGRGRVVTNSRGRDAV